MIVRFRTSIMRYQTHRKRRYHCADILWSYAEIVLTTREWQSMLTHAAVCTTDPPALHGFSHGCTPFPGQTAQLQSHLATCHSIASLLLSAAAMSEQSTIARREVGQGMVIFRS